MPWLDSTNSNTSHSQHLLPPIQQNLSSQSRHLTTWAGVLKKAVADDASIRDSSDILTNTSTLSDPLNETLSLSTTQDLSQTIQLTQSQDKSDKPPPTPQHIFRPTETTAFIPLPPAHPVSLPTAVLHSDNGTIKTSFRRWKWEASTLPRPAICTTTHVLDNFTHTSTNNNPQSLQTSTTSNVHNMSNSSNLYPQHNRLSQHLPPPPPPEFEAMLLAKMPRLSEARPAALAAVAAFRAITPFLNNEQRVSLHRSFATASPLECLTLVVRYAELASSQNDPSPRNFRQIPDPSLSHTPTSQPSSSLFPLETSSLGLLSNVAGQHGDLWVSPSSGRTAASWETIDRRSRSILQEPLQQGVRTTGSDSSPSSFDLSALSAHLSNISAPARERDTNQFFGLPSQNIPGSDLWWKGSTNNSNESDLSGSGAWDTYYKGYQNDPMDNNNDSRNTIFSTTLPTSLNVNAPPFRVDRPSPSRNDGL